MSDATRVKSPFIWDLATLQDFLSHPSEQVAEWTASRLLELYPEATEAALAALPQASGMCSPGAIRRWLRIFASGT